MRKYSSVRINFIMNFILTISNFIFPLITFPYVSRVLQASGVGIVTFATSVISYFAMIGMMGIPTYGIRAVAKVRDNERKLQKTVKEIMLLNAIVMTVAILLLFTVIFSIEKLYQEKTLYFIMSSTLIFNVLGVDWLYRGLEKYSYITIRSIIFKLLSLILMFLVVKSTTDYVAYGAITVFAAVGSNCLNFINLRKLISFEVTDKLDIKQHIRPVLTFFLLTVSATVYLNVDTTLLGFIKGDEAVGYYSAAVKIKQILVSVVTSLGTVLLPRLSFYYEQGNKKEFESLTQKALSFVFIISLPLMFYFILVAKESILFLSGFSFLPAVLPMQLIMPTILFIGISNLMGMQILVPTNRERLVVISTVVGAIVDILVNIIAIPLFGATGAAFASSLAELIVVFVQVLFLKELIIPMFREIRLLKIGISIFIASILTVMLKNILPLSPFLILFSTSIIFFGVYGLNLILFREKFTVNLLQSFLVKIKK